MHRNKYSLILGLFAFFLLSAESTSVSADSERHTVSFIIKGVRSDMGVLKTVLCKKGESFPSSCKLRSNVKASKGIVTVEYKDIPEDTYAFALFHDENDNGRIDMAPNFIPREGLAFGNDAMGRTGVPNFDMSASKLNSNMRHLITMRYLK